MDEQKTQYKHIWFKYHGGNQWACINRKHDTILGYVDFYKAWRMFCFLPEPEMVFSVDCMADIMDFISHLPKGN